jgi:hypothetical protein
MNVTAVECVEKLVHATSHEVIYITPATFPQLPHGTAVEVVNQRLGEFYCVVNLVW